jgi:hypothetical protein
MDVHCTTCREPWDMYHLLHEAVFDTTLSQEAIETWQALPSAKKLRPPYRKAFRAAGWEFGGSLITVIRCPCCPEDAKPNTSLLEAKSEIEAMLQDDPDGLAATYEDFDL